MGCCYSRIDREETVSHCKARRRCIKQLVKARRAFSVSHAIYLRSLRTTGSALLEFATFESDLHSQHHLPPLLSSPQPQLPSPPPPLSPTSTSSGAASPPAPPPPPPPLSSWDFWDPFLPSSSTRSAIQDEWEPATSTTASAPAAASKTPVPAAAPPPEISKEASSELTTINSKDLIGIMKELDACFVRAAEAGLSVSSSSEFSSSSGHGRSLGPLAWSWGSKKGFGRLKEETEACDITGGGVLGDGHCSTVERLSAWEKKLFHEVKNGERMKLEHAKVEAQLRKLEMKRADYVKTQKTRKAAENLASMLTVASQSIEATAAEIIKLRDSGLYPQLLDLIKELMEMWRAMHACHQEQSSVAQQLKFLATFPSTESTSKTHRQSALQLEEVVRQWHSAFCNMMKSQRDYFQCLSGWLRLSGDTLLSERRDVPPIHPLWEEWLHVFGRVPDRVASEGIKSFIEVIHAIVIRHGEEHKQKKKMESAVKKLEKKAAKLRSLENKCRESGCEASMGKAPIAEKRTKVELLKSRAEEERTKLQSSISLSRAMTLDKLQIDLADVFRAMADFSCACMGAYESLHRQVRVDDQGQGATKMAHQAGKF